MASSTRLNFVGRYLLLGSKQKRRPQGLITYVHLFVSEPESRYLNSAEEYTNTRTPVCIRARVPPSRFGRRLHCWWLQVFVYINTSWKIPVTSARKTVDFDLPFSIWPHIGMLLIIRKSGSVPLDTNSFPSIDFPGFKLDSPKNAFEPPLSTDFVPGWRIKTVCERETASQHDSLLNETDTGGTLFPQVQHMGYIRCGRGS